MRALAQFAAGLVAVSVLLPAALGAPTAEDVLKVFEEEGFNSMYFNKKGGQADNEGKYVAPKQVRERTQGMTVEYSGSRTIEVGASVLFPDKSDEANGAWMAVDLLGATSGDPGARPDERVTLDQNNPILKGQATLTARLLGAGEYKAQVVLEAWDQETQESLGTKVIDVNLRMEAAADALASSAHAGACGNLSWTEVCLADLLLADVDGFPVLGAETAAQSSVAAVVVLTHPDTGEPQEQRSMPLRPNADSPGAVTMEVRAFQAGSLTPRVLVAGVNVPVTRSAGSEDLAVFKVECGESGTANPYDRRCSCAVGFRVSPTSIPGSGDTVCERCPACKAGTFLQVGSNTANACVCTACPAGRFCEDQATVAECPAGSFCIGGQAAPEACPAGTFTALPAQQSCRRCDQWVVGATTGSFNFAAAASLANFIGTLGVTGVDSPDGCTICPEGAICNTSLPYNAVATLTADGTSDGTCSSAKAGREYSAAVHSGATLRSGAYNATSATPVQILPPNEPVGTDIDTDEEPEANPLLYAAYPEPGYYRFPSLHELDMDAVDPCVSVSFLECPGGMRTCLGGEDSRSSSNCAPGYDGFQCMACAEGYALADGRCVSCNETEPYVLACAAAVAIFVLTAFMAWSTIKKTSSKRASLLRRRAEQEAARRQAALLGISGSQADICAAREAEAAAAASRKPSLSISKSIRARLLSTSSSGSGSSSTVDRKRGGSMAGSIVSGGSDTSGGGSRKKSIRRRELLPGDTFVSVMKIGYSHLQVIALLLSLNVDWHQNVHIVEKLSSTLAFSSSDVTSSVMCVFDGNSASGNATDDGTEAWEGWLGSSEEQGLRGFYGKVVAVYLFPFICAVMFALLWLSLWATGRCKSHLNRGWVEYLHGFQLCQMILLFLAHILLVRTALELFVCTKAEQGRTFLTADPRIECFEGSHPLWFGLAGFGGLILFGAGIPALSALLVIKTDNGFLKSFLCRNFKTSHRFWESMVAGRKVALTVFIVSLEKYGPLAQGLMCMNVLFVALIMQLLQAPFVYRFLNQLETAGLVTAILTLTFALYSLDFEDDIDLFLNLLVACINLAFILFISYELCMLGANAYTKGRLGGGARRSSMDPDAILQILHSSSNGRRSSSNSEDETANADAVAESAYSLRVDDWKDEEAEREDEDGMNESSSDDDEGGEDEDVEESDGSLGPRLKRSSTTSTACTTASVAVDSDDKNDDNGKSNGFSSNSGGEGSSATAPTPPSSAVEIKPPRPPRGRNGSVASLGSDGSRKRSSVTVPTADRPPSPTFSEMVAAQQEQQQEPKQQAAMQSHDSTESVDVVIT